MCRTASARNQQKCRAKATRGRSNVDIGNLCAAHGPVHVIDLIPCQKPDGNTMLLDEQHVLVSYGAEHVASQFVGRTAAMARIPFVKVAAQESRKALRIAGACNSYVHEMCGCWLTPQFCCKRIKQKRAKRAISKSLDCSNARYGAGEPDSTCRSG